MLTQEESFATAVLDAPVESFQVRAQRTSVFAQTSTPFLTEALSGPSLIAHRLLHEQPLVTGGGNQTLSYRLFKRTLDVIGASIVLLLASPVMLLVLAVLIVTTKGKPIFTQERAGFRGRKFRMIKFRTMRLDADMLQHLVRNEQAGPIFKNRRDPRITRLGRILRATSIDELPQLFNILIGDMSLVGPRPLPIHEVARMEPWQRRRLAVVPGLTCLWQVSGRSNVGFHDWIRMDLWYVKNQSISTDLWLLFKTPAVVLACKGAY